MLKEKTLFGTVDKVKTAIKRLKEFEPPEGYYLAFSGGKDSIVIKKLADMSGVKYDAHYSVTTIDPPDLIYFMRKYYKDVKWERPKNHFLTELVKRGFPQRHRRWCCAVYKETGGSGRHVITGIRWAESSQRKNRNMVETCLKDGTKHYINIIIDWADDDVWDFIKQNKMPYCKLYDEGFKRLGCVMCPMNRTREREAHRYPGMRRAFIKAFEKMYAKKKAEGKTSVDRWENGKDMFEGGGGGWKNAVTESPDQMVIFE